MDNTVELRHKLLQYINTADEQLLRLATAVFENYKNEEDIVAHTIVGEPISREEYVDRNNKAVESYNKGLHKTTTEMLDKYKSAE